MVNKDKELQKVMGIPIFMWDQWDQLETGHLIFYNVEFILEDLKKFNLLEDVTASLDISGVLQIYGDEGTLFSGFLTDLKSFREEIVKQ